MEYTTRLDADPGRAHINYECPCGCTAGILDDRQLGPPGLGGRGSGRGLSAGSGAEGRVRAGLEARSNYGMELGSVALPWGEVVETALAVPKEETADQAKDAQGNAPVLVRDVVGGM